MRAEPRRTVSGGGRRLLVSMLMARKRQTAVVMACVIGSSLGQTALPLLSIGLLSGVVNGQSVEGMWATVGALIVFLMVAVTSARFLIRSTARLTQGALRDLREELMEQTFRLDFGFHDEHDPGELVARHVGDVDQIRTFLEDGFTKVLSGALSMVLAVVALAILDPLSGAILATTVVPTILVVRAYDRKSGDIFRAWRSASAEVTSIFLRSFSALRTVKTLRLETEYESRFAVWVEKYRESQGALFAAYGLMVTLLVLLANLTLAALLAVGGLRALEGTLTVVALLGSLLYARQFFAPVEDITGFLNSARLASVSLDRVAQVLYREPAMISTAESSADRYTGRVDLHLEAVGFAYSDNVVLHAIDLHIPAGQVVSVMGKSGSGKSTLGKLIARQYDPSEGAIYLGSTDIRELTLHELNRRVTYLAQDPFIFSGTVAANVAMATEDATPRDVENALAEVGILSHWGRDILSAEVGSRGSRLSIGQRQLIGFARALIIDPDVLILDEITATLDATSERLVHEALDRAVSGRTGVIIAHRPTTLTIADRLIVMRSGRIALDESAERYVGDPSALNKWLSA